MTEVHNHATPIQRPLSLSSFQGKLDQFEQFIATVTLQDTDASPEEKRQAINENLRYTFFCEYIRNLFGEDIKSQDLKAIHRKLSTNPEVKIDWSEVFGYFQNENIETEKSSEEISVFTISKRKAIGEAAGDKKRRDTIQSVIYSTEFDAYVTASQKGALSIYNGKLRLQNCFDINESAWMTSCQYLPKLRKVIATTERSIVIWDHRAKAKNHSSVHVIKPLEHSPQCMCVVPSDDDHSDSVLIGDDAGYVNLLRLTHNDFTVKGNKDQKRLMKYNTIDPASLTIPIIRRKFHLDWVLQVQYLPDLKSFASCSPGEKLSFVIANLKRLFDTQSVSELSIPRGVNAFCYSEKSNIFATGGVDKTIRVWHPNILSRPTGKMVGHLFTIIEIVMNEKDQHVISLSTARVFRVWDIHTLTCLQVFTSSDETSGERRISAMLFDARHDRLITGSNTLDLWPMTRTVQDTMSVPHTHDHPLTTVILNVPMGQIITICTESVIKVWEVETGRQMYQILEAHGPNIEVLSAAVDETGARMITGAYDGSLKVWEFGSGQEMKSYLLNDGDEDHSVLWISYLFDRQKTEIEEVADANDVTKDDDAAKSGEMPKEPVTRTVLALGWNNKLKIFQDDDENPDLVMTCMFDDMFEWPLISACSTPTVGSPTGNEGNQERKKAPPQDEDDDGLIRRKENVFLRNQIRCCALFDEAELPHTLVTGCSNGNLILWDAKKACVKNVFELAKAELASSYDSHRHRSKEQYPHRINDVLALCHTIFRPDPEEVKRRKKLQRKRMREEQGLDENDDSEDEDSDKEKQGEAVEDGEEKVKTVGDPDTSDPAEEVELHLEDSGEDEEEDEDEERKLGYGIDNEPIKMVEVNFPPVVVSCHQDTFVRFWSMEGELLCSLNPMTRILSPLSALCCDEHAHHLLAADAKGYITMWNVSEFLERPLASLGVQGRCELIKQVVCWRAHLTKIVALSFVNSTRVVISASTDGSVRVWYPQRGHYVGYFGQHRMWHISANPSLPSSPVLPYDITEGPLNPLHARSNRRKPQTKKYDYPLVFDADRWRPFRRSAYIRDAAQRSNVSTATPQSSLNIMEIRNKKFFSALVKPKADKSSLESDKPVDSDTGAVFHHLPVYRIKTPPPQPKPVNLGYEAGWGDGSSESGKAGYPGAGRNAGKYNSTTGTGTKTRRNVIGRKHQQPAGTTPSRRR